MIGRLRVLAAGALLAACVGMKPLPPPGPREAECGAFFAEMDRVVAGYGVADGGAARITGFPELRIDRFLASFAGEEMPAAAYIAWFGHLRKLDASARRIEWRNLPGEAAAGIRVPFGLDAGTAMEICGEVLAESDRESLMRRSELLARAEVPDAYSDWQRWVGLYPLVRWVVAEGVARLHRELRQPFIAPGPSRPEAGPVVLYAPPATEPSPAPEIAAVLAASSANPLAVPEPSGDPLERLFASFAPVFTVETKSGNDRIGAVRLGGEGEPGIDGTDPVVYRRVSHTRFGGRTLLQLNYLIWFPARPPQGPVDIYAGRFDGLVWRVTLGMDGNPVAYDSIHPCGCYYQIFPGPGLRVVQPQDGSEPVLSPAPVPRLKPRERLAIRLTANTHFIQGVIPVRSLPGEERYGWRDYDELRSLAVPGGGHRSLFAADGLVPGSARPERFLLWPMGVSSAGAMRQFGTHAIAFLGKRHFDDPALLDLLLRPIQQ